MGKTSSQEKYEIVKFVDNDFELEVNVSPSEVLGSEDFLPPQSNDFLTVKST